jgi:1-aminocyclopropane-1-carboxylate synthase
MSIDVEKEAGCHPGRVHQLYGASKDFCLNGLRIGSSSHITLIHGSLAASGCLWSRNVDLLDAFTAPALFMKVGSPSDALFSSLVGDPDTLEWFLETNQKRLTQAYAFTTAWLKRHSIPYIPSKAGHFVFSAALDPFQKTD